MAEFCTCGSIKIGGNCTNKNCANRENAKTSGSKSKTKAKTKAASKTVSPVKVLSKNIKPRRASKVVTYNLYDKKKEEDI